MAEHDLEGELDAFLAGHEGELIDFRRNLHAHPETGYHEYRTTRRIALRLEAAGLRPSVLPQGTRLMGDIGGGGCGGTSGGGGAGARGPPPGPTSPPCRSAMRRMSRTGPRCGAPATRAATTC